MDTLKKAVLSPLTDENGTNLSDQQRREQQITVDFNPETLDITLTNNLKKGRGKKPVQTVTDATAQLSVELIFDTTTSGVDVRGITGRIAALMDPVKRAGRKPKKVPAIVLFEWGTVTFKGYIDSYKEKLDFFSADGVPLRATVSLSLTQQERNFEPGEDGQADPADRVAGSPGFGGGAAGAPTPPNTPIDASAGGIDPGTAAALAAANGIENPRLPEVDQFALPDLSELGQPPVAFASGELSAGLGAGAGLDLGAGAGLDLGAGAGLGIGAGAGLDASAGIGLDAGAGFSASAGAGFSADAGAGAGASFSASASGVSGTVGAFSGLNKSVSRSFGTSRSSIAKLETFSGGLAASGSAGISLDAGAGVQLGGQAFASAGASLSAGVSATASAGAGADSDARVQAQISFLED